MVNLGNTHELSVGLASIAHKPPDLPKISGESKMIPLSRDNEEGNKTQVSRETGKLKPYLRKKGARHES